MEKSTKHEYVAIPTSDVDHEAALPAYEEQEAAPVDNTNGKRCRRLRFLLIGGAITLLGLTHLCNGRSEPEMKVMEVFPENAPEPCALRHLEQYSELKQHMEFLEQSFGMPHYRADFVPDNEYISPPPPPHHGHGEHPHKKHHHKHHMHHKHPRNPEPHHPPHHDDEERLHNADDNIVLPFSNESEELAVIQGNGHKGKKHHGHPREPFCKIDELQASSTVFQFSPEQFQRAGVFLRGWFSRGGHVRLSKSTDASIEDIKVNVTIYSGREDLQKEVKISAFDHEGQYAVQVERGRFHGHPKEQQVRRCHKNPHGDEDKKENCLVYNIDVEFPAHLDYYEDVELHIKSAQRIEGGKGLEGVEFGSVKAGLGRGAIIFDGLRAKKLMLGVLEGVVMGTYQPSESFSAGSVRGATKVHIEPTGENINVTASSTFGPASVDIPADSYSGDFTLFNLFGESSTIQAPNPEDIHVTKYRPTLKTGYYKEEHTGSKIVVAAKLHGGERLTFN